jgi:hypothetical protein
LRRSAFAFALLIVLSLWSSPAQAKLDILPLNQVHPGMRGTGRTVFSGGQIEEFGVEIVDVVRGQRPQGSLILFRGTGEMLEHAGIIAGMSGSPVYIDGKLVGAVAFAYPFLKDPIGAITPIEEMLELSGYPLPDAKDVEAMESGPAGPEEGAVWRGSSPAGRGIQAPGTGAWADGDPAGEAREAGDAGEFGTLWSVFTGNGSPGPGVPPGEAAFAAATGSASLNMTGVTASGVSGGLRPIPIPLTFTGWEPAVVDAARGPVGQGGFLAVAAAGPGDTAVKGGNADGSSPGSRATLEPGSAMALEWVGGDATIAPVGTVTAVDGDRIYAFGHPMVQGGPVAFPMFAARIHAVLPSVQMSTKMGSPTDAVGGVWQDRRAGVLGRLGAVPSTIPVRVLISVPGRADETYRYRVVRDPILAPMLLPWIVSNSYQRSGWLQGETTAQTEVQVYFDGGRTVQRSDLVVTDAPALGIGGGAVLPAALLLTNPYERVRLDSLFVRVAAEPGHAAAEVIRFRCTPRRAAPGDTVQAEVTLQLWRGAKTTRTARFVVPAGWEGKRLRFTAAGSSEMLAWDRDRAPGKWSPRDLDDLLRMVTALPSSGSLLIRVSSRDTGALVRGREIPGLPASLLSAGREPGEAASIQAAAGTVIEERVLDTPWDITGRETAEVEITR